MSKCFHQKATNLLDRFVIINDKFENHIISTTRNIEIWLVNNYFTRTDGLVMANDDHPVFTLIGHIHSYTHNFIFKCIDIFRYIKHVHNDELT